MWPQPTERRKQFGQCVDLCVELGKILAEYPPGENILFELLQNADDAGATKVAFVLDERNHTKGIFQTEAFAPWLGTALLAYNNSIFRPEDFEAIQKIGRSSKINAPGRTGKFGIGFNSVYHMTDVPSFISNTSFCLLDPVGITGGLQGRIDPLSEAGDLPELRPFRGCMNCDFSRPFEGTLFRFPLRNADHHRKSPLIARLRDRDMYTGKRVLAMFDSFRLIAHRALLFLRNVTEVTFLHYDGSKEQRCFTVSVPEHLRAALAAAKAEVLHLKPGPAHAVSGVVVRMEVEVRGDADVKKYDWLIVHGMAGISDTLKELMALDPSSTPIPPVGAVAVDLGNLRVADAGIYCTLPLPIITGLPVQLNSAWELPANRRTIWFNVPSDNRTKWNVALGVHVLAPLYVKLLAATVKVWATGGVRAVQEEKKSEAVPGSHALSLLWPTPDMSASQLLPAITSAIYRLAYVSPEPLFPVFLPPHPFALGPNSLFLPTHEVVPNQAPVLGLIARMFEIASNSQTINWRPCRSLDKRWCVTFCVCRKKPCVCPCDCKLPAHIVALPAPATKLLLDAFKDTQGPGPLFLTPRLLASALRNTEFFSELCIHPAMEGQLYEGEQVTALLNYLAPTPALALENLPGVPLALTITGTHYPFADKENPLAFCSSDEELEIINQSRSQVLHDCVRKCHSLLDVKTASTLNLIAVSPLTLGTTFLKNLLPKGWDKKDYVAWNPQVKAADPKTPSLDWLRTFWKYVNVKLAREQPTEIAATIAALAPWPLIPTISLRLYSVRSASIIFPSEQKDKQHDLPQLLSQVGCEVLPGMFSEIGKSLGPYMLQLTANGIIQALSNKGIDINNLSVPQATALLKHIANKAQPLSELSDAMTKALALLPLFAAVNPDEPLVSLSNAPYSWPALNSDSPLIEQVPNYVLSRPTKFLAAPGPELTQLYKHLKIQEVSLARLLLGGDMHLQKAVIDENKGDIGRVNFVQMVLHEARTKRDYATKLSEVRFVCQIDGQTCVMRSPSELMHIASGPDRDAVANLDPSLLLPAELAGLARDLFQLGVTRGLDDANTFMSCLKSLKVLESSKEKGSARVYRARLWLVTQFYHKHEQFLADERVLKEVIEQPFAFGIDCPKLPSAADAVLMEADGKEMSRQRLFRLGECVAFEDAAVVGRQCPCLCPDFTPPKRVAQRLLLQVSPKMLIAHLQDICQDRMRDSLSQEVSGTLTRLNSLYEAMLKAHRPIDQAELSTLFNLPCVPTSSFSFLPPSAFVLKGEHPIPSWTGGLVTLGKVLQIPEKATKQHVVTTLQQMSKRNSPDVMLLAVPLMTLLLTAPGNLPPLDQILVPTRDEKLVVATEVRFGDDKTMTQNASQVPLLHEEVQEGWKVARFLKLKNITEVCEWKTESNFVFKEVGNAQAINNVLQNPEFGLAVMRVIKHGLVRHQHAQQPDFELMTTKLLALRVSIVESIQARLYCGSKLVGKGVANIRAQLDRSKSLLRVVRANTPQAIRAVVGEHIGIYLDNPPHSHLAEMLDEGIPDLQAFLDDVQVPRFEDVDQALVARRKAQRDELESKEKARAAEEEKLQLANKLKADAAVHLEDHKEEEVRVKFEDSSKRKREADVPVVTGLWSYRRHGDADFTDFDIDTSQNISDNAFAEDGFDLLIPVNGNWIPIYVHPAQLSGVDELGPIVLRPPKFEQRPGSSSSQPPNGAPGGRPKVPGSSDPAHFDMNKTPDLNRTVNATQKPAATIPKDKPGQPAPSIVDRGCHPIVNEDLILIAEEPFRHYVPRSASKNVKEQMAQFGPQLGALLAEMFKNVIPLLPLQAIHLVWLAPADGHWTIAFNTGGKLHFNVAYYFTQLQTPATASRENLAMSWFMTLCHELAHNRVSPHDAKFADELTTVCAFYFKPMARWLDSFST